MERSRCRREATAFEGTPSSKGWFRFGCTPPFVLTKSLRAAAGKGMEPYFRRKRL
jgi:hypothetical protein